MAGPPPPATPRKAADYLNAFGAMRSPTSVTKMQKEMQQKFGGNPGPAASSSDLSSPPASPIKANAAEKPSSDEGIHGMSHGVSSKMSAPAEEATTAVPRGTLSRASSRQLPPRSARKPVNYALKPATPKANKSPSARSLLGSNTSPLTPEVSAKPATARHLIRQNIIEHTIPKRNAFMLAHKDIFLPLLPASNYITKLEQENAANGMHAVKISDSAFLPQPPGVNGTMKPYQLEGLSFLVHMYHNGMSSILGDEMGLGKTLQTLSLFQHLRVMESSASEEARPFLVICPLTVLSSWAAEAKKWTPDLKVIRFHGTKTERERMKQEALGVIDRYGVQTGKSKARKRSLEVIDLTADDQPVDIILTTYEAFVSEQQWFKRAFAWRYVVLDEGHKIKSDKTAISISLRSLQAEYRLLLTGTPLQNNLHELWALLRWLLPDVFTVDTGTSFKQAFDLTNGTASTSFMDHARRLLETMMLRRMKNSPGVNLGLPPKEEILLFVPLTPMQRFWYTRLLTKVDNMMLEDLFKNAKQKIEDDVKQEAIEGSAQSQLWDESKEILTNTMRIDGTRGKDEWKKLHALLMQLRKACSHPYMLPGAQPEPYWIGNHILTASGKFLVLEKLIQELVVKQRKKILIFAGWTKTLDMVEEMLALLGSVSMNTNTFKFVRLDGRTDRAKRNLAIRMFNDKASSYNIMLISTRAGGLGVNLTAATEVIFMDEDWNPQVTLQAEARSHRIGQTQKVTIYKLCTQGTVEEQMLRRIRKKLYLSTKVTESMRNLHTAEHRKRKRDDFGSQDDENEDAPLGTPELESLLRRGAQTLTTPELDIDEMLGWDFETTLEKCRDLNGSSIGEAENEFDESVWLNNVEKVECAIFEGKKHHRNVEEEAAAIVDLSRANRRVGKNTTVMVDGFAISKESMGCSGWEAVPTLAGKDSRLAEPKRAKKIPINNQEFCQVCWDGGDLICCSGCPRSYHSTCLAPGVKKITKSASGSFFCPQHSCFDCEKNTSEAGGLIYRCRWCEKGFCEDCLDFETTKLVGESLPEMEMLDYAADNGFYVDCHVCVGRWKVDSVDHRAMQDALDRIDAKYTTFQNEDKAPSAEMGTPATVSEAETPVDLPIREVKRQKIEPFE